MKGVLKWTAGTILCLIVLIVFAAILLPRLIDPNNYRDDISAAVYQNTGMTLEINGDISWSVFPWLGLSLNDLKVLDTDQKPFGELKYLAASVKLLPLLGKKVEVSTLEMDGLSLKMVVNKSGKPNWATSPPGQPSKTAATDAATGTAQTESPASNSAPVIDISSIAVTDLNISYQDIPARQKISITKARLETGAVRNGETFPLSASFQLQTSDGLKALLDLEAQAMLNPAQSHYAVQQLKTSITPLNASTPVALSLTGNMDMKQNNIKGNVAIPAVDLSRFMQQIHLPLPKLSGGDKVLRKVTLSADFNKTQNAVKLSKVKAGLDNFRLTGDIAVTNLKTQAITFNISGNDLNIDPYLPATESTKTTSSAPAKSAPAKLAPAAQGNRKADPVIIPVETIRKLNVKGKAQLASLTIKELRFDKPTLEVNAANGYARVTRLNAGFYKGVIDTSAAIDVRGPLARRPQVSAKTNVSTIDVQSLASRFEEFAQISGLANANVKIVGHGLRQSQIMKTLNGEVGFSVKEGTLKGVNFNKLVCGMIAYIRKEESSKTDWPEETVFRSLQGTFVIRDGVATNNNLIAALDDLNIKGDGDINLVQQSINYHIGLTVTGNLSETGDKACVINKRYADISWPVLCKGTLGSTQTLCNIDGQRLGKAVTRIAEKELERKLEKKLGIPLKGLFK